MICGLDVSSVAVGIALVDDERKRLLHNSVIKFNDKTDLVERAAILHERLKELQGEFEEKVIEIQIEEAAKLFGSQTMAQTISILQRFNGMASYVAYYVYECIPTMVNVRTARKQCGIKIDYKEFKGWSSAHKKKAVKQEVINHIKACYSEFQYELTRQGNFKPGTDDRADAIVMALYDPNS